MAGSDTAQRTAAGAPLRFELDSAPVATLGTDELMELTAEASRHLAAITGRLVAAAAELDRRQGWRAEGATSLEAWMVERCGVSAATARAWAKTGRRLFDLPVLAEALFEGEVSLDKVRALAEVATPESDAELAEQAKAASVPELVRLARATRGAPKRRAEEDYERRSLRFNDTTRTVTAQLPQETYAEVRSLLERAAKGLPSDGETPWDRRLCDALVLSLRQSRHGAAVGDGAAIPQVGRPLVVLHAPLRALYDEDAATDLAGELERDGLVDAETLRRIACDATIVLAVDDDVGHTMYEGRERRDPSETQRREIMRRDRHCRFPGCANVTFTNVHHLVTWAADGRTDLANLVLLCEHHHHRVHSSQWEVSGDANAELTFVGPTGRAMASRPSPLWGR
jgi:Domain of unknown function (DUF222)/HNH endonuclease